MPSVITNTDFDNRAAAVATPYGPLTRVGDVPDQDPNSNVRIEATTAISSTPVLISYDDMGEPEVVKRMMEEAHSGRGLNVPQVLSLKRLFQVGYELADSYGNPPFSDAELRSLIELIRTNRLVTWQPDKMSERGGDVAVANFTVADAGSNAADVTNTSVGKIDVYMWDWGDGTFSWDASPANHTYGSSGSKTIVLTVIGAGGIDQISKSVTLA